MITCGRIVMLLVVVITLSTYSKAFFLNWGSSDSSKTPPQPWPVTTYYQQRIIQPGPGYTIQGGEPTVPMQIPAIPIQLPLQAQFSPAPNMHNVQLVPCLCPISQDFEYEQKPQESSPTYISQKPPQN